MEFISLKQEMNKGLFKHCQSGCEVLDNAMLEIGCVHLQFYRAIVFGKHRVPLMLAHELCHGWECEPHQIHLYDFGLTDCHISTCLRRELWTTGAQCGLTDSYKLDNQNTTRDWLGVLARDPGLEWDPLYIEDYEEEFLRGYDTAFAEGIDSCIASWKSKLSN